jgi:hypothetical protein
MIHAWKLSDQVACTNFAVYMLERMMCHPSSFPKCASRTGWCSMSMGLKEVQLQDLGQSKSTCHMWVGEKQPRSERVGRLNAWQVDLDMPELYALPQLPPQTVLQQDGARPHFCHHFRNHLDKEMAGRWIGIGGPITWPPRSPDLTPLDFFLIRLYEEHCLPV